MTDTTDIPDFVEPFVMEQTGELVCYRSRSPTDEEIARAGPLKYDGLVTHQTWYKADPSKPGWNGDGAYIMVTERGGCASFEIQRTEGGGLRLTDDLIIPSDEIGAIMDGCEDGVAIFQASTERRISIDLTRGPGSFSWRYRPARHRVGRGFTAR